MKYRMLCVLLAVVITSGWLSGCSSDGDKTNEQPEQAANSQQYCDDVVSLLARHGLQVTELSTHLQGQLIAVHPAYDALFDGFAPEHVRGDPLARTAWATQQLLWAATASQRLGLKAHVTFSGALAWPYLYPCSRTSRLIRLAVSSISRSGFPA